MPMKAMNPTSPTAELSKMTLRPNDLLVVRTDKSLSDEQMATVSGVLQALPVTVAIVFLSAGESIEQATDEQLKTLGLKKI